MIAKNSFVASSSAIATRLKHGRQNCGFHSYCSFVRAMCRSPRYEGYFTSVAKISPLTPSPEAPDEITRGEIMLLVAPIAS